MNNKKMILSILVIVTICITFLFLAFEDRSQAKLNIINVNDIVETLAKDWDAIDENALPGLAYGMDYVVLDDEGKLLLATRENLNTDLNSAIINRDTIIDIKKNDVVLGKLIIYNDSFSIWQHYRNLLLVYAIAVIAIYATLSYLYTLHIHKHIIHPFVKLKRFAQQVAEGNLDIPLQMDKGNMFGAFTESFDLMREELYKARENERLANQSKKELVASLSHDIKTPVASIKAVSEIMQAKTNDEYMKKQLDNINMKADQINMLITNMFNATLEELQELKVTVNEQSSETIFNIIKTADYNHKVTISGNAQGIVLMDELRLSQVIDNIISNSYKYANTPIEVKFDIVGRHLTVTFKDEGSSLPEDELPLVFNKYYRAKNAEGKSGTGLGLYISKYLMNKMSGDIECNKVEKGFSITIKLLLA